MTVVNIYKSAYDVYIGRAGKGQDGYFGNPYRTGIDGTLEQVLEKYEKYARKRIQEDPIFRERVKNLLGKRLGCFCAPKKCHGDILLKLCRELNDKNG